MPALKTCLVQSRIFPFLSRFHWSVVEAYFWLVVAVLAAFMTRAKRKKSKRRVLRHARTHGTQSKHIHAYFKWRGEIRDCTEHVLSAGIFSERAQRKFLQEQPVSESARSVPAREQERFALSTLYSAREQRDSRSRLKLMYFRPTIMRSRHLTG